MKKTLFAVMAVVLLAPACGGKNTPPKKPEVAEDEPERPAQDNEAKPPETTEQPTEPKKIDLSGPIYFEFDRYELRDEARGKLEGNFDWLKANPQAVLTIEGHCDEAGTNEYNIGLGERRARAARDYLVRLGADPKRIRIISYGEERLAQPGRDEVNRRDEFVAE